MFIYLICSFLYKTIDIYSYRLSIYYFFMLNRNHLHHLFVILLVFSVWTIKPFQDLLFR